MVEQQELAPVDGGSAAWRLLAAAFVFETLLWGKVILIVHQSLPPAGENEANGNPQYDNS